jgi:hypothetical protein
LIATPASFLSSTQVSSDVETAHQALGVLANLAETVENMKPLVEAGVLHRLK